MLWNSEDFWSSFYIFWAVIFIWFYFSWLLPATSAQVLSWTLVVVCIWIKFTLDTDGHLSVHWSLGSTEVGWLCYLQHSQPSWGRWCRDMWNHKVLLFLFWIWYPLNLCDGEGNGNLLQCSCLENPRDGGAWRAAVYGVAQSRTRVKWLSNSSSKPLWRASQWIQAAEWHFPGRSARFSEGCSGKLCMSTVPEWRKERWQSCQRVCLSAQNSSLCRGLI